MDKLYLLYKGRKSDMSGVHVFVHRFDSEQSQAQEEVQKERSQREKLSREKDMLTGEVFSLRQQLEVSRLSLTVSHPLLSHLLRCNKYLLHLALP